MLWCHREFLVKVRMFRLDIAFGPCSWPRLRLPPSRHVQEGKCMQFFLFRSVKRLRLRRTCGRLPPPQSRVYSLWAGCPREKWLAVVASGVITGTCTKKTIPFLFYKMSRDLKLNARKCRTLSFRDLAFLTRSDCRMASLFLMCGCKLGILTFMWQIVFGAQMAKSSELESIALR